MRVVGRISCYDKSSKRGLIETKRVQIKQSGFPKGILFHADINKSFRYKDVVVFDLLETDGTYNVVNVNHSINEFNFILENFFLFSSFERSLCYGLFKDILEGKLLYDKSDIIFDFILDNWDLFGKTDKVYIWELLKISYENEKSYHKVDSIFDFIFNKWDLFDDDDKKNLSRLLKMTYQNERFSHKVDCIFDFIFNKWGLFGETDKLCTFGLLEIAYVNERFYYKLDSIFDFISNKWDLFNDDDRKRFSRFLENVYEYEIFQAKAENLINKIDDEVLNNLLCLWKEKSKIKGLRFVDDCKRIIGEVISLKIAQDYSCIKIPVPDELATIEEVKNDVITFFDKLKPIVVYKHTLDDAHDKQQRYKWDGSEYDYIPSSTYATIGSELKFLTKGFHKELKCTISYSADYEKALLLRDEMCLILYSSLKNSKSLWKDISEHYRHYKDEYLRNFEYNLYNVIKPIVIDALRLYFSEKVPYHGAYIVKALEDLNYIEHQYFYFNFPCNCNDIGNIRNQLKEIDIYRCITDAICININKQNIISNIYNYYEDKVEVDGLLLSKDGSILYDVVNWHLKEIIIPDSVKIVEDGAFENCRQSKIHFLGHINYIGHGVFNYDDYEIIGDFSELSYVGYNISNCHIKIKNEIRTMKELAYHYNMEKIKSTKLLFEKYHITYYNGMDYSSRVNLLSSMEV